MRFLVKRFEIDILVSSRQVDIENYYDLDGT